MRIVTIFLQIIAFPASFFVISYLLNRFASKKGTALHAVTAAVNFSISSYVIGGFALFPLWFLFQPVNIDGVWYLFGGNLWAYWLISFIIITPLVVGFCAYFFYFKRVSSKNIYKDAIFIGLFQVPLGWFFEIIIYVYWIQTIPTIYDYFLGKNFPWIMINWAIGAVVPLIMVHLMRKGRLFPKCIGFTMKEILLFALVGLTAYWFANAVLWFPWVINKYLGMTAMILIVPISWGGSSLYCLQRTTIEKFKISKYAISAIFLLIGIVSDYFIFAIWRGVPDELYHPTTFAAYAFIFVAPIIMGTILNAKSEKKFKPIIKKDIIILVGLAALFIAITLYSVRFW